MIGFFPWIARSDLGFSSVCTRSKAMNHWVTKKDDLFNVGPIHTLGRPGVITEHLRTDREGTVDAGVPP